MTDKVISRVPPATLKLLMDHFPCEQIKNEKGEPMERWVTCPARLRFSKNLFVPKKNDKGDDTYSCALVFPVGADLSPLNAARSAAAAAKFGPQWQSMRGLKSPFKKQDDLASDYDGFAPGGAFINVSSQYKPVVLGPDGKSEIDPSSPLIYEGMWVCAKLTCYAYDTGTNKGVSFGLSSLQKIYDDENLGGSGVDNSLGYRALPAALAGGVESVAASKPNGSAADLF